MEYCSLKLVYTPELKSGLKRRAKKDKEVGDILGF